MRATWRRVSAYEQVCDGRPFAEPAPRALSKRPGIKRWAYESDHGTGAWVMVMNGILPSRRVVLTFSRRPSDERLMRNRRHLFGAGSPVRGDASRRVETLLRGAAPAKHSAGVSKLFAGKRPFTSPLAGALGNEASRAGTEGLGEMRSSAMQCGEGVAASVARKSYAVIIRCPHVRARRLPYEGLRGDSHVR